MPWFMRNSCNTIRSFCKTNNKYHILSQFSNNPLYILLYLQRQVFVYQRHFVEVISIPSPVCMFTCSWSSYIFSSIRHHLYFCSSFFDRFFLVLHMNDNHCLIINTYLLFSIFDHFN